MRVFGQALVGAAHGFDSLFPQHKTNTTTSSANAFAFDAGGGVEIPLNKFIAVRPAQVDYLYTTFPNAVNGWQNNLRVGGGLVLRFPRPQAEPAHKN
jgi:hypothetical protein